MSISRKDDDRNLRYRVVQALSENTALDSLLDFAGTISALVVLMAPARLRFCASRPASDYDAGQIQMFGEDYRKGFEAKKAAIGYMPQMLDYMKTSRYRKTSTSFADLFGVRGDERRARQTTSHSRA
jgi:hypothetical protein